MSVTRKSESTIHFINQQINICTCVTENPNNLKYATYVDIIEEPLPELQVSFMSRHLSFTDEALLPKACPMVAQSLPYILRSLVNKKRINKIDLHGEFR